MRILITGGYGFIGSHVADKFYREGHEIFIIDNLSTGKKKNFIHKHRFYGLNTFDPKCEAIFTSNPFDLVIHLAGQSNPVHSEKFPFKDAETDVLGLINMLNLCTRHKVKKLINISSMYVYGQAATTPILEDFEKNPDSMMGMNHDVSEYYCSKWQELYGLDTVSLRASFVYGPRQRTGIESNLVAEFLECADQEKAPIIYGDGSQSYDFIYVEDLATAIYKMAALNYNGVLNLGSGKKTSVRSLVETIGKYQPFVGIDYQEKREDELKDICLDIHQIQRILDWIPETSIEDGIQMTCDWHKKAKDKANDKSDLADKFNGLKSIDRKHGLFNKLLEKLEDTPQLVTTIELGIVYLLITYIYIQNTLSYKVLPIDLYLAAIILFSALYGSRFGIYAFTMSVVSYVITLILTGRDPMVLIYSADFYFQMAYYIFIAFVIGYIKDKMTRDVKEAKLNIELLRERMHFLNDLYRDVRDVRDELQNQIINSEDSFGKIFSIVQELNSLNPEEVFGKAIVVIERLMKTKGVAIFKFNETSYFARVMAFSYDLSDTIKKSIKIEETASLKMAIATRELVVNHRLEEGQPIMVMPVLNGEEIIGGIMIFETDFENLTLSYQNYFKVITGLISSTLSRAYEYDEAIESKRYYADTSVMKQEYFEVEYQSKLSLKRNLGMSFVLLSVEGTQDQLAEISEKVNSIIRDTDCIGYDGEKGLTVILGNTNEKEAQFVIERLKKMEIEASIVERIEDLD